MQCKCTGVAASDALWWQPVSAHGLGKRKTSNCICRPPYLAIALELLACKQWTDGVSREHTFHTVRMLEAQLQLA